MKKSALRHLLAAMACVISPVTWADVPLPADISINPPTQEVRKEIAAFSGKWIGNWSGTLDAVLIIESIDNEKAEVIYAWGDAPAWNTKRAYGRFNATVVPNGRNEFSFRNSSGTLTFTVTMNRDLSSINVQRTSPTGTLSETFKKVGQIQAFSYEDKDWGVAPTSRPQGPPFGRPTPMSIPGARMIRTLELKALLEANKQVVVIDVLDSKTRTTVPGAYWMPGAGDSRFYGAERSRFAAALERLVGSDKNRPVVFLCLSSECWESYNACLHALDAGYKDVLWYRGGTNAWDSAGLDRKTPESFNW